MQRYPRTYRVTRGWRVSLVALSLLLALPSAYGSWYFATSHEATTSQARYLEAGIFLSFFGLGAAVLASTLRSKLVLFADRIEIHELTRVRVVRRAEIAGWRFGPSTPPTLRIETKSGKAVTTAWIYTADAEFDHWLSPFDNLDEVEASDTIDEIASDRSLGDTPEERVETLHRARRWARVINTVGFVVCAWAWFYPAPYNLVIGLLLAAPWLAAFVGWMSRGLIQFDARPKEVRPTIALLFLMAAAVLALRALLDFETLGWRMQCVAAFAIGGALFLVVRASYADVRAKGFRAVFAFVVAVLPYGFGAAVEINGLLDSSVGRQAKYLLREKRVQRGKTTTYLLSIERTAPDAPDVKSATVSPAVYQWLENGKPVCLYFHPGVLGITWFVAAPCPFVSQPNRLP